MTAPSSTAVRRYTFERFLNARSAQAPSFSPDGTEIAFLADITGVAQVWRVPVQGGWPDQLTFTADRVMSVRYAHHRPVLVFGMDAGGNEREQLFGLEAGQVWDLTVDEAVMHTFGVFSPDDRQVAFSDNRRNPAYFDVWIADLDGSNQRCVYQQDGSNYADDWSRDGHTLLLSRRAGSLNKELFTLDLRSGAVTHLTPHEGQVNYAHAQFTPDAGTIFLTTDQGSEFMRAARMTLQTRELEFLTPDEVDVEELQLSPRGTHLALVRNIGGYSRLSVRSIETGEEVTAPGLPAGVIAQVTWAPNGETLAFSFTAAAYNPNIWVWELDAGTTRQVTHVAQGGIPPETFVSPELVHFPSFDGLEIPAFLYLPEGEHPPVVVHVHGGPEGQTRPGFNAVIQYLVNQGYAVLAPNVRGSIGYGRTYTHLDDVEKRMDSVADLQAAANWLRSSGTVDSSRLAVMGGSYGGFMTLAAITTYPELWAAAVDIVGIANFETFFKHTGAYRRHWRTPEYGDPETHADLFRRISPIHYVDRIRAPLMVVHGDNDPRVPVVETEQIAAAVSARGIPVEVLRFADEGHGVVKLKNKLVAYPAIGAFLDRYLKPE